MQMCTVCGLQGDVTDFRQGGSQKDGRVQQLTASVLHKACHAAMQMYKQLRLTFAMWMKSMGLTDRQGGGNLCLWSALLQRPHRTASAALPSLLS